MCLLMHIHLLWVLWFAHYGYWYLSGGSFTEHSTTHCEMCYITVEGAFHLLTGNHPDHSGEPGKSCYNREALWAVVIFKICQTTSAWNFIGWFLAFQFCFCKSVVHIIYWICFDFSFSLQMKSLKDDTGNQRANWLLLHCFNSKARIALFSS